MSTIKTCSQGVRPPEGYGCAPGPSRRCSSTFQHGLSAVQLAKLHLSLQEIDFLIIFIIIILYIVFMFL